MAASNLPFSKTGNQKVVWIYGPSTSGKTLYAETLLQFLGLRGGTGSYHVLFSEDNFNHREARTQLAYNLCFYEEVDYKEKKYSSKAFKTFTGGITSIDIGTFHQNEEGSTKRVPLKTIFLCTSNGFPNFKEGRNKQEDRRTLKVIAHAGARVKERPTKLMEDEAGRSWFISACVNYVADMLYEGKQKELLSFTGHDEEFRIGWDLQNKPSISILANTNGLFKLVDSKVAKELLLTKKTLKRVLKKYDANSRIVREVKYDLYVEDFENKGQVSRFGKRPRVMGVMIDIDSPDFLELDDYTLNFLFADDPNQLNWLKEQRRLLLAEQNRKAEEEERKEEEEKLNQLVSEVATEILEEGIDW
ncbi:hypothetical protein ACIL4E_002596 [Enterococcus hirae]